MDIGGSPRGPRKERGFARPRVSYSYYKYFAAQDLGGFLFVYCFKKIFQKHSTNTLVSNAMFQVNDTEEWFCH